MSVSNYHSSVQQLIRLAHPQAEISDYYINETGELFELLFYRNSVSLESKSTNLQNLINRVKTLSDAEAGMSSFNRDSICIRVWNKFQSCLDVEFHKIDQHNQKRTEIQNFLDEILTTPDVLQMQQELTQNLREGAQNPEESLQNLHEAFEELNQTLTQGMRGLFNEVLRALHPQSPQNDRCHHRFDSI